MPGLSETPADPDLTGTEPVDVRPALSGVRWEALPYHGERAGTGPATWGQRLVWRDIARMPVGTPYNVTQAVWVPDGVDLDTVRRAVVALAQRYEALRTVVEPDGDGALIQRVLRHGDVLLGVWAPDGDPAGLAAEGMALDVSFAGTHFEPGVDTPFRVLVLAPGGQPRVAVVCAAHLAADLQSTRLVGTELTRLLAAGAPAGPLPADEWPVGIQPLELAEFEASERGRSVSGAALRYLRGVYDAFPLDNFDGARHAPASPRHQRGILDSAATLPALAQVAARYRVSTATVALAVGGALLGTLCGAPRPALLLVTGNRLTTELRASVGTLTQHVPALLDLSGATFADVLRATWSVAMRAYRHGRFDPADNWQLLADIERDRGEPEVRCFFNDMRASIDAPVSPADPAQLAAAARDATFAWIEGRDSGGSFFLELGDVTGAPELARWTLLVDSARVPLAVAQRALYGLDDLLIELIDRDVEVAEVPALLGAATAPIPS